MHFWKKMSLMLVVLGMVVGAVPSSAAVFTPETDSDSAVLIDLNTGRVLAEKIGGVEQL